ncbi:50S ribosomal protein L4, partial [Candidatus Wolfebacteria bacterium RIFOXYB2_FULL_49_7]
THGPSKDRDFSKKINKKMKRIAIFSVFSKKFADNNVVVVDSFAKVGTKTKEWADALRKFVDLRSKTVVIFSTENRQLSLALGNIKNVDTLNPASINVYDLMKYKNVIIEQSAIAEIEQHYKI